MRTSERETRFAREPHDRLAGAMGSLDGSRALAMAVVGVLACAGSAGCSDGSGVPDPGDAGALDGAGGSVPIDAAPPETPSGYLYITANGLEMLRGKVEDSAPEWVTLRQNVDDHMDEFDPDWTGPENIALVYLLTEQPAYAEAAYAWASAILEQDDVAFDSYLYFGDRMREIALVLNYAGDALSASERQTLATYLDRWANELWFDNQGSGWGLEDPGNNYHMAFLEGTACAGYALRQAGDPAGQGYVDLLRDRIERSGGVFEYIETRAQGGDWLEGANYGQRSKQRLFSALSVMASMGDTNYFTASSFFADSVRYAIYALEPDDQHFYPAGDLTRDVTMPVSPYDRAYIQMATAFMNDAAGKALGQWFLETIVPDYTGPGFDDRAGYYLDVLFAREGATTPSSTLPLVYRSPGTEWVHFRSGWDEDATSVGISGSPLIDQSHAHFDVGSFTIWKHDWLAVDATTYSSDGLNWDSGAHNMVHVEGHERRDGVSPGLLEFYQEEGLGYVQLDASQLFRRKPGEEEETMLDEYTRELVYLAPNTLVVYDRVTPKPSGEDYDFRIHFANPPTEEAGRFGAQNGGGGIALQVLAGGTPSIESDDDLVEGASSSWRVEVAPDGSERFLAVLEVASGSPPALAAERVTANGSVDGVLWDDEVVVFSSRAFGQATTLPFSYAVSGTVSRTHTLVNLAGPCSVSVAKQGGSTTVTVSSGSSLVPSDQGVARFTE